MIGIYSDYLMIIVKFKDDLQSQRWASASQVGPMFQSLLLMRLSVTDYFIKITHHSLEHNELTIVCYDWVVKPTVFWHVHVILQEAAL